jgi:hypothetical protein
MAIPNLQTRIPMDMALVWHTPIATAVTTDADLPAVARLPVENHHAYSSLLEDAKMGECAEGLASLVSMLIVG